MEKKKYISPAIARALVKNPDVIFADEPTGNLDSNTTEQIIKLIKEISKEKLVVVVSHNLFDAYEYADRIIELSEGRIINDLVINEKYENAVEVKDNKVIIPMLKRFKQDELDSLLSICKRDEILKIEQSNNKFKQKEQKEEPLQAKKSINLKIRRNNALRIVSTGLLSGKEKGLAKLIFH